MKLTKNHLKFIEENKCRFISFKYFSDDDSLKQIDISVKNLPHLEKILFQNKLNLQFIDNKFFLDPFRSHTTMTVFCEDIIAGVSKREQAGKTNAEHNIFAEFVAHISFWTLENINLETINNKESFLKIADPIDRQANLRTDIMSILENIAINTLEHYHGTSESESVISIRGKTILELIDNIKVARYIIAGCVENYGMQAYFYPEESVNLRLSCFIAENYSLLFKPLINQEKIMSDKITAFFAKTLAIQEFDYYFKNEEALIQIGMIIKKQYNTYVILSELLDKIGHLHN